MTDGVVIIDVTLAGRIEVDWDGKVPPTDIANEVLAKACQNLREEPGIDVNTCGYKIFNTWGPT